MDNKIKTSFKLRNVEFKNRVFVASGTFGYCDELIDLLDISKLGGIFTKSISFEPRIGNPPPRIVETPSGLLNSIGLANIGVKRFIEEKLPLLKKIDTKILVNIAGSSIDEYCDILETLELQNGIAAYEINVSCPNVKDGGASFGMNRKLTSKITSKLRKLTDKPLIIKLTPNVTHISEFAKAVEDAGADAISLVNTFIGMAIDIKTRKPRLSTVTGGYSGPAIKPMALAKVYEAANSIKIPIFGIGGITNAEDAIEFLLAGASAIQIGTMNFVDPSVAIKIIEGIEAYALQNNFLDLQNIVGSIGADIKHSILKTWL